jgi:hypothetical protein
MRGARVLTSTVLASAVIGAPVAVAIGAPASAIAARTSAPRSSPGAPTRAQITHAVRQALRSRSLWATVHICNSPARQGVLGIRGQMPALGFPATLSMVVRIGYWSPAKHRFVPDNTPNAVKALTLGLASSGLHQDGAEFQFTAPTGLLNATVQFTWTRSGRVIGQSTRRTTAGHHDAYRASPPGYSAAQCRIT